MPGLLLYYECEQFLDDVLMVPGGCRTRRAIGSNKVVRVKWGGVVYNPFYLNYYT
jgi:hypothetical protein